MTENQSKNSVHYILAHSYFMYFFAFILGLFLDYILPLKIFEEGVGYVWGLVLLILGTFLIFWAQKTSSQLKIENISKHVFLCGPYKYTRTPTHYGLFFVILGFGLLNNMSFIIILSTVSFLITKFYFIKKQ